MSRAISPGWGVIMMSDFLSRNIFGSQATTFRPSASMTRGTLHSEISPLTTSRLPFAVPIPGPMATASIPLPSFPSINSKMRSIADDVKNPASSGSGSVIASVSLTSKTELRDYGTPTVTSPAPARSAPLAQSAAAPVSPGEPATMRR